MLDEEILFELEDNSELHEGLLLLLDGELLE
jgi:hypothetical protein